MRQQFVRGAAILLMTILLMMVVSCGSAAEPIPPPNLIQSTSTTVTSTPPQSWGAHGTLTEIDNDTLTLTTEKGVVKATISPDITIQKIMLAYPWDLHVDQFLSVIGNQDTNNNITATSILIWLRGQSTPPSTSTRPPPGPGRPPRKHQGASGILTVIDDDTLTLTTPQGPMRIIVSSNTTVRRVVLGTTSDLTVGIPLSVTGNQDNDGNITATSIRIRPQSQDIVPTSPTGS